MAYTPTTGRVATTGRVPATGRVPTTGRRLTTAPPQANILAAYHVPDWINYANNDQVNSFWDVSGAGRHGTQATGSKRGIYTTGWTNGLPAVFMDGTDDDYTIASLVLPIDSTVYMMGQLSGTITTRSLFGNTGSGQRIIENSINTTQTVDDATVTRGITHNGVSPFGPITPSDVPILMVYIHTAGVFTMRRDGIDLGGATTPTAQGVLTLNRLFQRQNTNRWQGYVSSLRIYSAAHSAAIIAQVENYYARLYGRSFG